MGGANNAMDAIFEVKAGCVGKIHTLLSSVDELLVVACCASAWMSCSTVPALCVNVSIHVLCVFALMSTVPAEGRRAEECQSQHFLQIQEKCREANDALLEAEGNHDDHKVCTSLYGLFHCVALHVPVCFQKMTELYNMYFHSPHNCVLTVQQLQTLQRLTLASANKHNDTNNNNNNGNVDTVSSSSNTSSSSTTTTTTTTTTPLQSMSPLVVTVVEGGGEEGGGGGSSTGEETPGGTEGERRNTTRHKHTGSDAAILGSHCSFTKVAISWLVAWLVTSSFPHS
ncbi:hypothetical protein ACOMHN_009437 [Nucella lapillus]